MFPATFASKTSSFFRTSNRIKSLRRIGYPLIFETSSEVSVFQVPGSPHVISRVPDCNSDLIKSAKRSFKRRRLAIRFTKEKPLTGLTLGACLHVTKETGVLMDVLAAGGAKIALCGSNPLSTQDDVAAALSEKGIHVFAWRGQTTEEYYRCIDRVLDFKPAITLDDGADVVGTLHSKRTELLKNVKGGTEETTTGVVRLRAMENAGSLQYAIIAVNDAYTKYLFDNRYGTGQSTIDGILRATNVLLAGKTFVVSGYGGGPRGLAAR